MRGTSRGLLRRLPLLRRFFNAHGGAVAPLTALMLIPMLGAMALAVDVGYWYKVQRNMQSAADSAALAAAQAGADASVDGLAKATAAKSGFTSGTDSVTVTGNRSTTNCPSGVTGSCTKVTITNAVSLYFAPIVGILGNSSGKQGLSAVAVAGGASGGTASPLCLYALAKDNPADGLTGNGIPKVDLAGCSVYSGGNMTCNTSNDMNAPYGFAVGTNNGCAKTQVSGATPVSDPYAARAKNIPANTCGGNYPQEAKKASNDPPGLTHLSGAVSGSKVYCGDVRLTGNVTVTGADSITIMNGNLDLNGFSFTATGGTALIFSGTTGSTYSHIPTGTGTLSIQAPQSGNWDDIAIYQDPTLTQNVNISYAGNNPTWNLTGVVYAPHSSVTLSGIVNKAGSYNCFILMAENIVLNGTGQMFNANPSADCSTVGIPPPTDTYGSGLPWLLQ